MFTSGKSQKIIILMFFQVSLVQAQMHTAQGSPLSHSWSWCCVKTVGPVSVKLLWIKFNLLITLLMVTDIYELLHRKSVRNVCYRGVTKWITEKAFFQSPWIRVGNSQPPSLLILPTWTLMKTWTRTSSSMWTTRPGRRRRRRGSGPDCPCTPLASSRASTPMRRMKHLWSRLVIYAPSKEELDLDERTSQVKVGTQKSAGRNKKAPLTAPRSLGFKRVSGKLMECLKIQWPDLFCLKGGGRNMADRNISRASASRWSFCFKPHH